MTRRERLEAKADRRREWAESRAKKSAAAFAGAHRIADGIPFGQPILVGHHSEGRARRDQARIENGMARGCESADMAKKHSGAAAGIERQLRDSIFSDDDNAAGDLEAKAARIEGEADRCVAINKEARKGAGWVARLQPPLTESEETDLQKFARFSAGSSVTKPIPSYHITNLRANARRCRERVKQVNRQQEQAAKAEEAGGLVIEVRGEYAVLTFPDYPGREVVNELKAAGFHWSRPSWYGPVAKVPESVRAEVASHEQAD